MTYFTFQLSIATYIIIINFWLYVLHSTVPPAFPVH